MPKRALITEIPGQHESYIAAQSSVAYSFDDEFTPPNSNIDGTHRGYEFVTRNITSAPAACA